MAANCRHSFRCHHENEGVFVKKTLLGLGLALTTVFAPQVAFAEGVQNFNLHNKTGMDILSVYIRVAGTEDWSKDILGTGPLATNGSTPIKFTGFGDSVCKFDVQI